jgi:phage terminase small subunit
MARELTAKQARFVSEYLATGNASEAYRRAYNCKSRKPSTVNAEATRLLAHPSIAPRLGVVKAEAAKRLIEEQVLTREWVLEKLMLNARMAMGLEDIPFSVTENGVTTRKIYRKVDHAAATKALELLGKVDALGMFVDRKQTTIQQEFAHMDDMELDEFIKERMN